MQLDKSFFCGLEKSCIFEASITTTSKMENYNGEYDYLTTQGLQYKVLGVELQMQALKDELIYGRKKLLESLKRDVNFLEGEDKTAFQQTIKQLEQTLLATK